MVLRMKIDILNEVYCSSNVANTIETSSQIHYQVYFVSSFCKSRTF